MSKPFEIVSAFKPSGDQPVAIQKVVEGINSGLLNQTLKGNWLRKNICYGERYSKSSKTGHRHGS